MTTYWDPFPDIVGYDIIELYDCQCWKLLVLNFQLLKWLFLFDLIVNNWVGFFFY